MNKICFDRILPKDLRRYSGMSPSQSMVSRLAAVTAKQWINGSTLRVKFMGGTLQQQQAVVAYAPEWSIYANIKFVFTDDPGAEIRISFEENGGGWSYPGNDCLDIPRDYPTMNLGWCDQSVILHEFGHALACIHEHQSPAGGIQWNREQVIKDLSGAPNFWNIDTIEHNMFEKYDRDQINGTEIDLKSIMMYAFPASWTTNGWQTAKNEVLSDQDKAFIASAKMYPKPATPVEPAANILPISFVIEKAASIAVAGEEDLYALVIETPGTFVIQTSGSTDVVMGVYGPNSKTALIAKDDDSGVGHNAWLSLNLGVGVFWVSVRHYSKTKKGDYKISCLKTSQA